MFVLDDKTESEHRLFGRGKYVNPGFSQNPSYQNLAPIKNLLNKQGRSEDVNLSEEEEIDDE